MPRATTSRPRRTASSLGCGLRPRVDGGDGQRGGRAARAGDRAEPGPGAPSLPAGGDDEHAEGERAAHRLGLGRVGETVVRLGQPEQRDPGSVGDVAVRRSGSTARSRPAIIWSLRP